MSMSRRNEGRRELKGVLIISQLFRPHVGGVERHAEDEAFGLLRCGIKVFVVTCHRDVKTLPREILHKDGVSLEVRRLPNPNVRIVRSAVYLFFLFFHLLRHRRDYDVIHLQNAHGYHTAVSLLAARLLGKKVLSNAAGAGETGDVSMIHKSQLTFVQLFALRRLDRVIALSRDIEKELLGVGVSPEKIEWIPYGVDTRRFRPLPPEERAEVRRRLGWEGKKVVLFVGRLAREKCVDVLIGAFRMLVQGSPGEDFGLVVVGDGGLRDELEGQVAAAGLEGKVTFTGIVDDPAPFMQGADVFTLPSRFEGLPNALLQAMMCSLPSVATRVSGSSQLIRHGQNGLLVEPEDAAGLCGAIKRLLDDPGFAARLGEEAHRGVEEDFSMQAVARRYVELFDDMINPPS